MGCSALNSHHFHAVAGSVDSASTMAQNMNSMVSQPSSPENRVRSRYVEVRMMRTTTAPHWEGSGNLAATTLRISIRTAGNVRSNSCSSIGGATTAVLIIRGHAPRRLDPLGISR